MIFKKFFVFVFEAATMKVNLVNKNIFWIFALNIIGAIAKECFIPAICNNQPTWTRLSQNWETTCKNESTEVHEELTKLTDTLQSLQEKISDLKDEVKIFEANQTGNNCDVVYNYTCFKAIFRKRGNVSFEYAEFLCNEIFGKPANIYDATHYSVLQDHLRQAMPDLSVETITVWSGMRYENNKLTLRSGENYSLPAELWRHGFPYEDDTNLTNVILVVKKNPDDIDQGMRNFSPLKERYGALCEI